jgi:hypothetical protein
MPVVADLLMPLLLVVTKPRMIEQQKSSKSHKMRKNLYRHIVCLQQMQVGWVSGGTKI